MSSGKMKDEIFGVLYKLMNLVKYIDARMPFA